MDTKKLCKRDLSQTRGGSYSWPISRPPNRLYATTSNLNQTRWIDAPLG
jgi:hypothetical protein